MAFILAGAIIKSVKDGIQAHKDYNNPEGLPPAGMGQNGIQITRGPVYGLVIKAEGRIAERRMKGKGKAGARELEDTVSLSVVRRKSSS
jgi:hypothetical protein